MAFNQHQNQYHNYNPYPPQPNHRPSQVPPSRSPLPHFSPSQPSPPKQLVGFNSHHSHVSPRPPAISKQSQPYISTQQTQLQHGQPRSPMTPVSPGSAQRVLPRQPQPVLASPITSVAASLARSDYSPSPTSPTQSQFSRRPLPTPQPPSSSQRSGTAPALPPFSTPQSVPVSQSRHRHAASLSMQTSVTDALLRSKTITSPATSPVAPPTTSSPNTRPLPYPSRSTKSVDSNVDASLARWNSLPHNSSPHLSQSSDAIHPAPGQKFVPMWKRALPTPSPTKTNVPRSPTVAERRGVSQVPLQEPSKVVSVRPLPPSPESPVPPALRTAPPSSSPPGPQFARRNASPPSPPSSKTPSPTGSLFTRLRDRSQLPGPSGPAPTGALPSRPDSIIKLPKAAPLSTSPDPISSSDDDSISDNPLLARRKSPSPTYGIRDLPARSRDSIANHRTHGLGSPTRAATMPQPASPIATSPVSPKRSGALPRPPSVSQQTSSTFHIATSGLGLNGGHRQASPGGPFKPTHPPSAIERSPKRTSPQKWPVDLPPLPNPPPPPSSYMSPRDTTPVHTSSQGSRKPSLKNPLAAFLNIRKRASPPPSPSLDDAPPPSLRRTSTPDITREPLPQPSTTVKPVVRPNSGPPSAPVPRAPLTNRSTSSTAEPHSTFSLSQFPRPPGGVPAPLVGGGIPPRSQANKPSHQDTPRQPAIPKISLPVSTRSDSEDDGLVIVVSGETEKPPRGPKIAINGSMHGDPSPPIPTFSFSDADDTPKISVSRPTPQTRRNKTELPPLPAVRGKGGLVCGGCGGPIIGRIVSAMGVRWHPGCFRCCVCNELLENLSSYEHEGRPFCHLDYHEQYAPRCYHCQTAIVDELYITLDDPELGKRTYHEQHFFCAECGDPFLPPGSAHRSFQGDGVFKTDEDDVGFTVYHGHPYCEPCHVRLRMPKCQRCKKSIRDGMQAVEALGGKWCWACFTCASCNQPFEDLSFFLRDEKPFCEHCFSVMLRNEL